MTTGKRAGSRRAARPTPSINRSTLAYAAAITVSVIAWGYLVYAAIDFGSSARNGNTASWALLLLAGLGAAACLFVALMLVSRLIATLGGSSRDDGPPSPPRPPGGRRAAR